VGVARSRSLLGAHAFGVRELREQTEAAAERPRPHEPRNGESHERRSRERTQRTSRLRHNPVMRTNLYTVLALMAMTGAVATQGLQYPNSRTIDQVDVYHGTKVADPYRWLEDDTSAETAAWVEAQNKVTFAYLDQVSFRKQLLSRL
jgi:Prolyl oligopeptidase, N-terminal beta-propeller domain